uniref:Nuclear nucleic acid-binding protein C1D n=1 Tax=Bos taurus TaxID=9913 RepID=A0AAA9RVS7_BOVIN
MMAQTSLDQGGSSQGGRTWLDSEYVLKIGQERSQGSFCNFRPEQLKSWSCHEMGKTALIIMAGEGINEDYPVEIHEYLSTFENSIGAVDEMLKTMMSVSRNELLQKLDPLEQAKVDLVSAYTLNSMFWVYLATQGVNPKEHPVKQELERIRVYMNRVKEITDKKKAGKLDRGAASRFVKNALWEPKPKNASKVANKGKSKN